MDSKVYDSSLKDALAARKRWIRIGSMLAVSQVLMTLFLITRSYSEKTIIAPCNYGSRPEHNEGFTFDGNDTSPQYIEFMAVTFVQRALTYHPRNANTNFDFLVRNAHPSVYSELKAKYAADSERIKRQEISSVFYPMSIQVQGNTAVVSGELESKIGTKTVGKKLSHFEIEFSFEGKLYLKSFVRVEKSGSEGFHRVYEQKETTIEKERVSANGNAKNQTKNY